MATAKKTAKKKGKKLTGKAWAAKMKRAKAAKARERGDAPAAAPKKKGKRTAKSSAGGKAKKLSGATLTERVYGLEQEMRGVQVVVAQHHKVIVGMLDAWRRSKGLKSYGTKVPGLKTPKLFTSEAARGVKVSKLFGSGS